MDALVVANELTDAVWSLRDAATVQRIKTSIWSNRRDVLGGQIDAYTEVLKLLNATRKTIRNEIQIRADQPKHLIDM